jgi:hypothetical protein
MKSIRNIAFTALLTLGAFSAITYTSCNKDECKDVVCQNGGSCLEGTCSCATGYEGTNCETASSSKLVGVYSAKEDCSPGDTWSSSVSQSTTDKTKIVITNFGDSGGNISGQVSKGTITLDAVTVSGVTVTGTGTVNGSVLTITYSGTGASTFTCTMTMTKQ